jgi:hypothetical protein
MCRCWEIYTRGGGGARQGDARGIYSSIYREMHEHKRSISNFKQKKTKKDSTLLRVNQFKNGLEWRKDSRTARNGGWPRAAAGGGGPGGAGGLVAELAAAALGRGTASAPKKKTQNPVNQFKFFGDT